MWSRPAAAAGLLVAAAALAQAQPGSYSRALPPDRGPLERLNLRTEWTLYLPIDGKRDNVALVQTVDDQLFVQSRTGLFVAVDARTGQVQWSAALGNGGYTNVYPVAANSQFVYVTNVTKLFAFYRYTGVTEFVTDLGTPPQAAPVADESGVYVVLGMRPGSAGAHRVAAYNLPRPIILAGPDAPGAGGPKAGTSGFNLGNPVDDLTRRYPSPGATRPTMTDDFGTARGSVKELPVGGVTGTRSPSLAVLPKVTPPYTAEGGPFSPSLVVVPSMRQPYHLRDESGKFVQRTPSVGTIPPSVAAAMALTDLRPKGVEPTLRWEMGLAGRVLYPLTLTPSRVWAVTDDRSVFAVAKVDRRRELVAQLPDQVLAPPGQAGTIAYAPLADGDVVAVDLTGGDLVGGINRLWRATVGGLQNHTPFVTQDAVYAAGDNSGVTRIDRATGDVVWKSDRSADLVIAANQEFVYVRDRQGRMLVFDARRATDPAARFSAPLSGIDLAEFNVPVVNTVSDRIFLAADNGLLVCLRDASPKYAAPVRINPGRGPTFKGMLGNPGGPGLPAVVGVGGPGRAGPPPGTMLDDIKALAEPERGKQLALPDAVKLLEAAANEPVADVVFVRTYSTKLNEKAITEKYGPPLTPIKGPDGKRLLIYGWLMIGVDPTGEIIAVGRRVREARPGQDDTIFTVEERAR